jgi:hypothetical protein
MAQKTKKKWISITEYLIFGECQGILVKFPSLNLTKREQEDPVFK